VSDEARNCHSWSPFRADYYPWPSEHVSALSAARKANAIHACNWYGPCCVLRVRKDDNRLRQETNMNTLSSKLTAFGAALVMNSLIMGAVGFLFELQSHPHLVSVAKAVVAHQWLI
jgi:hypothetical protein